jgi:anaerobic selenocysteine-containing dehydrogenase
LDADGKTLLSGRVAHDEPELLKLIGDVLDLADGRPVTCQLARGIFESAFLAARNNMCTTILLLAGNVCAAGGSPSSFIEVACTEGELVFPRIGFP